MNFLFNIAKGILVIVMTSVLLQLTREEAVNITFFQATLGMVSAVVLVVYVRRNELSGNSAAQFALGLCVAAIVYLVAYNAKYQITITMQSVVLVVLVVVMVMFQRKKSKDF